jgi:uncharacterized protein (TIGR02453 family)
MMETVYAFLRDLAKNNNREWFQSHKDGYQESLELVKDLAAEVLNGITQFDPTLGGIDPKDTLFRIYKDVRFSKDKTPYKTHFGCWMAKGGRKSTDAGYYLHLEPDNTFMAAGVHSPQKEQLTLIRQEILYHPDAYLKVINHPVIKNGYERAGKDDMLKKGPAGFPGDFKYLDELKYKHYIFVKNYVEPAVLQEDFPDQLIADYRGLYPLVEYLNHAMSFTGNE